MFDPQMEILITVLRSVTRAADPGSPADAAPDKASWSDAQAAMASCGEVEEDVELAVGVEDADALSVIVDDWLSSKRHLLVHDRDVLKRALKAFRKRLKVTVLDAESSIGGGPMSSGQRSTIVAVRPPDRYPRSVWDELVRQKRLVDASKGMYELPPE